MSIKVKTFLEGKNLIQRFKKKIKKSEQDMSKIDRPPLISLPKCGKGERK